MLDTSKYQFVYTADSDQPYWLKIQFGESSVTVTFVPAEPTDIPAFWVVDNYNGEELSRVNITHEDMVRAWHDIVTKAHHHVLELHAEAIKQAERDRLFGVLVENFFEAFEAADKYSHGLREVRGVNDEQLRQARRAAEAMRITADALDLIADPD